MTLWLIFIACILFLSWVQQCLKVEEEEEWWGSRATSNAEAKGRFRRNHSTPFSACILRVSQLMAILTQNTRQSESLNIALRTPSH